MDVQYFKGDADELKFDNSGEPTLTNFSQQKDDFFEGAYSCFALGDLLYDTGRSPLANAIDRVIFREAFATIFEAFVVAGSYESYITVFKNIFGDDVVIEFVVPAAGRLQINIEATGVQLRNLYGRTIVSNAYVYDEVVDHDGNNIAGRSPKGFQTEYETEQMLFELVPDGIFTEISLTIP